MRVVHEAEIRIAVVEVLGDGRIGARFHFGGKGLQIGLGRFGLRMHLRVGSHFNRKVLTRFGTDETHQIAGILKLATRAVATGQVASQSHQTLDAHGLKFGQLRAHAFACRANA